jgi:hypothetical protein
MRYFRLTDINARRLFDPSNEQDLRELQHYIKTNQWTKNCPFYLEEHWDNIPAMCMQKYTEFMLDRTLQPSK